MIEIDLRWCSGDFQLNVDFIAADGVIVLFGSSGAGKTTLINLIAGLLKPTCGRVVLNGAVLFDRAGGIDVSIHRRRIGCVFQEHLLFPHLSVRGNLLYGRSLRARGGLEVEDVISLLGLGKLLKRHPHQLSGGERQRVALGRALLANPRLLLMDEPLASLDAARRSEIIPYIENLCRSSKIPIVYVTHNLEEVARLADTLIILQRGQVVAAGAPGKVSASLKVHQSIGPFASFLEGQVISQQEGFTELRCSGQQLWVPSSLFPADSSVRIVIPAHQVTLSTGHIPGSSNSLAGRVAGIRRQDSAFDLVGVAIGSQELVARVSRHSIKSLGLAVGRSITALVNITQVFRSTPR